MATISASLTAHAGDAETGGKYAFDGKISREVLENYLARSLNMLNLDVEDDTALEEDLRMVKNVGAKHLGFVTLIWFAGDTKVDVEEHFRKATAVADKVHRMDPEIMLQAGVFETISAAADSIPIPEWVFREYGVPAEKRTFSHRKMLYDRQEVGHGHQTLPPDISKIETRLWFYYWSRRYIDAGYENIHLGMIGLMDKADSGHACSFELLDKVRAYAKQKARRHFVLFDSQYPYGVVENGKLLFDFHQMQLRPKDVVGSPEKCILEMGYGDTIYGKSKGGLTPSGWSCDHLPYFIQFDNGYPTGKEGKNIGFPYAWGRCELDWFAHQPEAYRNEWLRYAWKWLRDNDPAGYLQMPGFACDGIIQPVAVGAATVTCYRANTRSKTSPNGFSQEETIKAIWSAVPGK